MSRWRVLALALVLTSGGSTLVLTGGGCLGRTVPLPPPGVSIDAIEVCDPAQCPAGGVIVRLSGNDAQPEANIHVVDHARCVGSQCLVWWAQANAVGAWSLRCGPQQLSPGMLLAPQNGDGLEVYQELTDTLERSDSRTITIGR